MNNVRYRSNSHISKKPQVVRTTPVNRSDNLMDTILREVLPSKEEFICDILLPTIRRSIRSKLYE